jgi:acyl carrier protein
MDEIAGTIEEYIRSLVNEADRIEFDRLLLEEGLVVSIHILSIVTFLEENFSIQIDPFEVSPERFESIRSMASFVEEKRGEPA